MGVLHGSCNYCHEACGGWRREWAFRRDVLRERAAFHVLHAEVRLALDGADFVNRDDVRMLERGELKAEGA